MTSVGALPRSLSIHRSEFGRLRFRGAQTSGARNQKTAGKVGDGAGVTPLGVSSTQPALLSDSYLDTSNASDLPSENAVSCSNNSITEPYDLHRYQEFNALPRCRLLGFPVPQSELEGQTIL